MKLIFSFFIFVLSASCLADDGLCVAQKDESVSYASYMDYTVNCQGGVKFKTKSNITTVLLPIPYNWNKIALQRLQAEMTSRKDKEVVQLKQNQGQYDSLIIFETEPLNVDRFCSAVKTNVKPSGINNENEIFSVDISCDQGEQEVFRDGVTEKDLSQYMAGKGLKSVLQFYEQSYNSNGEDLQTNPVEIFRNR
jgi:hypothetical protein